MRSSLHDAENQSEYNQGIKTWVKQVRDVAYDAEDIVEEFLLRFSLPCDHGLAQSLCNCDLCITQLRAQPKLAVQIRTIKLRIKAISNSIILLAQIHCVFGKFDLDSIHLLNSTTCLPTEHLGDSVKISNPLQPKVKRVTSSAMP